MELPKHQLVISKTQRIGHKFEPESMTPLTDSKPIKIKFTSSISDQMKWKFVPGIHYKSNILEVSQLTVVPGETALTFFKVMSNTNSLGV